LILSPTRRSIVAGLAAAPFLRRVAEAAGGPLAAGPVNPIVRRRADAQVFRHSDGMYYMTGSVPEYDRLVLRRSPTLAGLTQAREVVLWRHLEKGPLSGFIWAPELHLIDGRWIMYFAAGPSGGGEDVFRIRTYAVVCDGPDPMTGKWSLLGQLQTPWDTFALDSTSFVHRGTRYLCWAQREPGIETNSNLYLAPLATPLALARAPVRLSVPTLDWEIRGFKVNEAPALLEHDGRLFLTYSASATDERYCLGMLTARADADIMQVSSWTKSQKPVFVSSAATSVYGPGHNSFTTDEHGRDMLVYHGRDYREIKGDPLFDPNRETRVQRLYYHADGTPDFGVPVGNGPLPVRLSPAGQPKRFARFDGARATIGTGPLAETQFRLVPSAGGTVAFEPILRRGEVLVHGADGTLSTAKSDGSRDVAARSSFRAIPGGGGTTRYRAAAGGDAYLIAAGGVLRVGKAAAGAGRFALS
jgi:GH43 family beta-xylosidase